MAQTGSRAILVAPLLRKGEAVGTITIRRDTPGPFTHKQVKLLETFAAQAVIAIENVRLFQEVQARNRDLTEALDQQTATSEILRVISSSPTDLQPVLDAVAESAARVCGAADSHISLLEGEVLRVAAIHGEHRPSVVVGIRSPPRRPPSLVAWCVSGGPSTSTTSRPFPRPSTPRRGRTSVPPVAVPDGSVDRGDQSDPSGVGELLRGRERESVPGLCAAVGREEGAAPLDEGEGPSRLRLGEVEYGVGA